jgi:hypothetical protein
VKARKLDVAVTGRMGAGMLVVRRLYPSGGPWGTGEGFTVLEFTPDGARVALSTYRTEALAWAALRAERASREVTGIVGRCA